MNGLLRSHVTRVGFDLTLGQTHIAALVRLAESIRTNKYVKPIPRDHPLGRADALFAPGMDGLVRRGLVIHHYDAKAQKRAQSTGDHTMSMRPHYTITAAGNAVIVLLKEAGLYEEYATAYGMRVA